MAKKLYRSKKDCIIAGVCGGMGGYFNIDPTILRILAVLLIFASGVGILAYIVAWIIIPQTKEEEVVVSSSEKKTSSQVLIGAILVVVGALFLLDTLVDWFRFKYLWPLILIALGIAILIKSQKREKEE